VRLGLAALCGALFTAACFLAVLLARSAPEAPRPAAFAGAPAAPKQPRAGAAPAPSAPSGLGDVLRDMQRRMRDLSGGGGFSLRFGGDDVDLEVEEEGDTVVVVARVQGAVEGTFDVKVNGRFFTLSGERRLGGGPVAGTFRFTQTITLPADVDASRMTSELKDGVLRVRLPKKKP
jgi:HSP20 family protein